MSFLGFDVLEVLQNGGERADEASQPFEIVGPRAGAKFLDENVRSPHMVRAYEWPIKSIDDVAQVTSFVDSRKGRAIPFWMVGQENDLELASTIGAGGTALTVVHCGYSSLIFPQGPGRRYLRIRHPITGNTADVKVINAVNNGDGTETLTLDGPPGTTFQPVATKIHYLRFSRMDSDEVELVFTGRGAGLAIFRFKEIPLEAP